MTWLCVKTADCQFFGRRRLTSMRALSARRFVLRCTIQSMCVVAFLTCDCRPVRASCGDYLTRSVTDRDGHSLRVHQSSSPLRQTPGPVCSGPHCKQRDQSPMNSFKGIVIAVHMDVILAAEDLLRTDDDRLGAWSALQCRVVDGPIDRIFKPPRA